MKTNIINHTENSLNQSTMSAIQLIDKAVEMGMKSIAITNLDNILAIPRAFNYVKEKELDINIIAGAEIRVNSMDSHLILLAKNYDGFLDLCNIITEANEPSRVQTVRVTTQKIFGYPIASFEILEKYNNGNLIVLSGGKDGVLNSIMNSNESILVELEAYKGSDKQYQSHKQNLERILLKIETIKAQITEKNNEYKNLEKDFQIINTKYQQHGPASLTEEDKVFTTKYMNVKKALDALKSELDIAKKQKTLISKSAKETEDKAATERKLLGQIVGEQELYTQAYKTAYRLKEMYGNDFFICIQNHMFDNQELALMKKSANIALQLQIPMVACNDVYMLDGTPECVLSRQIIRFNGSEKFEELSAAEKRKYLLSETELRIAIKGVLEQDSLVEAAMNNITYIEQCCHMTIENKQYHYPKFSCENAEEELKKCAFKGLYKKYMNESAETIESLIKKTEYELSVINNMGFADYLLIVKDFIEIGRKAGTMSYDHVTELQNTMSSMTLSEMLSYINTHAGEEPGEGIGPGRGSAAGSQVCFQIGITNIDPLKYGLMFERFLNPERVSMPDIDTDFSFESRAIAIEYCRKKYGEGAVCGINTESTASAKADIKLVARAFGKRESEGMPQGEAKAVQKQYLHIADEICKCIPNTPGITLEKCMESILENYKDSSLHMSIVNTALTMEGCVTNYGTHAAGIIIGDQDLSAYIAKSWDINNLVYKVQCDMIEAEGLYKLLKMDFLGLRTLSIITKALRLIKKHRGISIDIDNIPFEDVVFKEIFRKRRSSNVFQFESNFMKDIMRQISPENIMDLIMINAIGRPGPMKYVPEIAAVKSGKKTVNYLIPEMADILDQTYGYPVYQEQVMQLMQLAGMTAGEADNVRRHMSKKHYEEFEAYRPRFVSGMVAKGADEAATNEYWDGLIDFAKYGFNKSHAACYSVVAYQTAWLKYHYPAEFLCSCMIYCEQIEDLVGIIEDAKDFGVEVMTPDINNSHAQFDIVNDNGTLKIQFGICSLKGCGDALETSLNENEYFESLADFIDRKRFPKAITLILIQGGAMDCFHESRRKLQQHAEVLYERLEKIKDLEKKIKESRKKLEVLKENQSYFSTLSKNDDAWKAVFEQAGIKITTKTIPNEAKLQKALAESIDTLEGLRAEFYLLTVENGMDHYQSRLRQEKEVLGFYVSEHPTEYFILPDGCKEPNAINQELKNVKVCGLVSDLRIRYHKENGKPMAFFTLTNKTGSVKVNCFTKAYAEFGTMIQEDKVLIIEGYTKLDDRSEDEFSYELCTTAVYEGIERTEEKPITLQFYNRTDYESFVAYTGSLMPYANAKGNPLYIVIHNEQKCYDMQKRVSNAIVLAWQQYMKATGRG